MKASRAPRGPDGLPIRPVARPLRRRPKPLSPAEERELESTYRDLVMATPAPSFPAQPRKPKEATMSTATAEAPTVTAKKGDKVRVVHRNTDGGWRLWETETNKMIVKELFASEQAAVKFAKAHGLDPVITGLKKAKAKITPVPKPGKKKAAPATKKKRAAPKKARTARPVARPAEAPTTAEALAAAGVTPEG